MPSPRQNFAKQKAATLTLPALVLLKELCQMLRITDRTCRTWLAAGRLPPPLRLGRRKLAWRREVIDQFLLELEEQGADNVLCTGARA